MFAKNLRSKKKVREVLPLSLLTTHPTSFQLDICCFIERIFAIQWGAIASLFLFRTTIVYKTTWKGQLWNQTLDRSCFQYLFLLQIQGKTCPHSCKSASCWWELQDTDPTRLVPVRHLAPAAFSTTTGLNSKCTETQSDSVVFYPLCHIKYIKHSMFPACHKASSPPWQDTPPQEVWHGLDIQTLFIYYYLLHPTTSIMSCKWSNTVCALYSS